MIICTYETRGHRRGDERRADTDSRIDGRRTFFRMLPFNSPAFFCPLYEEHFGLPATSRETRAILLPSPSPRRQHPLSPLAS